MQTEHLYKKRIYFKYSIDELLIHMKWSEVAIAYQASPSMGSSRQEYWSGLPFSSPGDLPDPGI